MAAIKGRNWVNTEKHLKANILDKARKCNITEITRLNTQTPLSNLSVASNWIAKIHTLK